MKHNIFGEKLSIFGDIIEELIFKQTETFGKPPMKLTSNDGHSDIGEDTSPYGDVDNNDYIGTNEENALLKDDSEDMDNKENNDKSRRQKEKEVATLTINVDMQNSGHVVISPVQQLQKSGNKITKEVEEKKIPDENDMTQSRSEEGTKQHDTSTCSSSSNCSTCITSSGSSGSSAPIGNDRPSEESESHPSEDTESDNDEIKQQKKAALKILAEDAIKKSRGGKKDTSIKSVDVHNAYFSPDSKNKCIKNYIQKIGTSGIKVTITLPSRAIEEQPQPKFHANKPSSSGSKSRTYSGNHAAIPVTNKAVMPNNNKPVMPTNNKPAMPTKNKAVMPTNNRLATPMINKASSTSKMQEIPDDDTQGNNKKDKSRSKDKKKEDKKCSSATTDEKKSDISPPLEADKCDHLDETNKPPSDMEPIPDEAFEIIY